MNPVLDIADLKVVYGHGRTATTALRDCNLTLRPGEILAVVGESGCGKSSLARAVAGVRPPSGGRILLEGQDIAGRRGAEAIAARRAIQMVFQDPDASLNPHHAVAAILDEPLMVIRYGDRAKRAARVRELMDLVRLDAALLERRPSALSGGQKQRVAIARALAMQPKVLIADEALSALDLTTQARMAALFLDIRQRLGVAILFISHDMRMVAKLADAVCVIQSGEIVEYGAADDVMLRPQAPYTQLLLAAGAPETMNSALARLLSDGAELSA